MHKLVVVYLGIFDNVLWAMKCKNVTQKQLADYLGVGETKVSDWKSGRIKSYMKYIDKIADFLGVSVDYLLTDDQEKKPAQLRHALALTTFYADFASRYEVKHFAREPTVGSIRPDALVGYIDGGKERVVFVEVELSNKGFDYKKYQAFELNECKQYFGTMPKIIVVTDKNWESCEKYEVWRI